jgi:hypothetical protein
MRQGLEQISRGEKSPSEATAEIKAAIADGTADAVICAALTTFVWRALTERRRDLELREWHRVTLNAEHAIYLRSGSHETVYSGRLKSLADLIRISIQMSDGPSRDGFTPRYHEKEVYDFLLKTDDYVDRDIIQKALGLQTGNLSRVLMNLIVHGFIEIDRYSSLKRYRTVKNRW